MMLSKISLFEFQSPFHLTPHRAKSTPTYKHISFSEYFENRKYQNQDLILVMRRLPHWLLSFLWQQSLTTYINKDNKVAKRGQGETYANKWKDFKGFLYLPKIICHFTYPDYVLNKFL